MGLDAGIDYTELLTIAFKVASRKCCKAECFFFLSIDGGMDDDYIRVAGFPNDCGDC